MADVLCNIYTFPIRVVEETEDKQVDQGRAEGEVDTTGADEVDTAEKVDPGRVEEVATVRQVVVVRVEEDCPVDEEWTEKVM